MAQLFTPSKDRPVPFAFEGDAFWGVQDAIKEYVISGYAKHVNRGTTYETWLTWCLDDFSQWFKNAIRDAAKGPSEYETAWREAGLWPTPTLPSPGPVHAGRMIEDDDED